MNQPRHPHREPKSNATAQDSSRSWPADNRAYLQLHLKRLRLLLHRRILWLRKHWQSDSLPHTQGMIITDNQADWLLTGEDRKAKMRYYRDDPQAGPISQSVDALDGQLNDLKAQMDRAGTQPALEIVARLFGLLPFEQAVLLLCLAPELDPGFERLYGYVQDDVNRKYATANLADALFGTDRTGDPLTTKSAFHRNAPLRRYGLIHKGAGHYPGTPAACCPLTMDERMTGFLQGINSMDTRLDGLLKPIPFAPISPAQEKTIEQLTHLYGDQPNPRPVLNLIGPSDAGKQALAGHLCRELGLELYHILPDRLPVGTDERQNIYRLLCREAVLIPTVFYIDTGRIQANTHTDQSAIEEMLQHLSSFIVLGGNQQWQSDRPLLTIQLTRPDRTAQACLWQKAMENVVHNLDGHIAAVVQQFDFGPQSIVKAISAAAYRNRLENGEVATPLTPEEIWQACRQQAGAQLDDLAQRIVPSYGWDDIVLPPNTLDQLKEIAAQVAHRHTVYETWGFGAKLSRGRGISALFVGPSGTGKTMAAEIMANHLGLDLFRIDLAGVVSKYIGETEKNLKKVFDTAEQSGSILFFDEADALFGKRTEVKDSHDRYANIEVNYLLQRMEDYRGLAILATNRKSALDRAFLRRLRFLVDFPFPNAASRKAIWQKVFPKEAKTNGLDTAALARMEISGGNIRNIALNAAFLAADEQQPVGMIQVLRAARREYTKIDKMMSETEFGACYRNIRTKGNM